MLRKEAIAKINAIHHKAFNDEQKQLACAMLEKAPDHAIKAWYDFIIQRVKLGFTFDYAPEPNVKKITLIENQPNLNIIKADNQLTHKLIIGDNYDGLKNLLITHRKKIDIIYIDPPYNTESASSDGNNQFSQSGEYIGTKAIEKPNTGKFSYRDKFARTGWLNMLNERLKLAKELLSDQGVIFVSIDDNEQAYLKVLMDDIFGEENFICNFIWERTFHSNKNSSGQKIFKNGEYLLFYAINKNNIKFNEGIKSSYEDAPLKNNSNKEKELIFPTNSVWLKKENRWNNTPIKLKLKSRWGQDKINSEFKQKTTFLIKNDDYTAIRVEYNENKVGFNIPKQLLNTSQLFKTLKNPTTERGTKEIEKIFKKENVFPYPKPINYIKYILRCLNQQNATVLDFYAGSGTTAHAVMDLNREDGGKRECILITNNENNIAYDVTYERLHRIIKHQGTNGETDFVWLNQKIDYSMNNLKVFKLKEHDIPLNIDIDQLLNHADQQLKQFDSEFNCDQDTLAKQLQGLYPLIKK